VIEKGRYTQARQNKTVITYMILRIQVTGANVPQMRLQGGIYTANGEKEQVVRKMGQLCGELTGSSDKVHSW
jgi:hypothetical protein